MSKIVELSNPQNVSMSDDWYELTDPNHFWLKWRFNVLKRKLKPILSDGDRILEIGCGNGTVMRQFEDYLGIPIEGCDLNKFVVNNQVENLSGTIYLYNIHDLHSDLIGQFDLIILLDVIEHIDDVKEFLTSTLKHLKNDGKLIINVPAHNWLFSKFDVVVGHKRRYNIEQMKKTFAESNIDLVNVNYWGFSFIPLIMLRKLFLIFKSEKDAVRSGFEPPNNIINKIMLQIMNIELKLFSKVIYGTSVMAVGRKRNQSKEANN